MTRAEATARLGVVRSAMGAAVDELARLELVRVGEQAHSPLRESAGRGRTSPRLEPAARAPLAAAVSLQPTGTDVALVQFGGAVLAQARLAPVTGRDPAAALAPIAGWIERSLRAAGRPCLGVGVGVAGIVSGDGRSIVSALYLDWHDVSVADILSTLLPTELPVRAHNDGSLTAFAEYHHGAGRDAATLLVLGCEHVGISGAMLTQSAAQAASLPAPDHAFELGHLALDPYGPPCPCGQRGCLELYCDGRALNRALGRAETD
ncbi:MAG: ROK family protein, partial [Actinocrinis sp.]